MRVRRILETALDCDDLPRTAAFYTKLLDVTPMLDSDRLVAIDAGEGTVLLLFQRGAAGDLETPGGIIPGHDSGGPGHLAFAIDAQALADWESRLGVLGIAIESRVTWERGGVSLYFRDPDNRSVEIVTRGMGRFYSTMWGRGAWGSLTRTVWGLAAGGSGLGGRASRAEASTPDGEPLAPSPDCREDS